MMMMMIGRCSKGQHHIAVLVLAPDERTNEQNASLRWEKNVGVGLNNTRFGPHERKVCIKFVEAKETRKDLERYFLPWGKEGDYKEISLSLEYSNR